MYLTYIHVLVGTDQIRVEYEYKCVWCGRRVAAMPQMCKRRSCALLVVQAFVSWRESKPGRGPSESTGHRRLTGHMGVRDSELGMLRDRVDPRG